MIRLLVLVPLLLNVVIAHHTTTDSSSDDGFFESIFNFFEDPLSVTLPGTKWCGPGDEARSDDDLGTEVETDKCCRAHDQCPEIIEGRSEAYGLKNDDLFTRLSCDCEKAFSNCLKNGNKTFSLNLGRLYFRLRGKCFRKDYPIISCIEKEGTGLLTPRRCIKYQLNTTATQIYQYFDTPYFYT